MSMVLWFKLGGGSAVKSPWHNVMYVNPIHTIYGMYTNVYKRIQKHMYWQWGIECTS